MKYILKLSFVILCGGIGAAIPVTGFYLAWSWCMAQVPMVYAWAGLAKITITLALVAIGGGATIGLAVLGGMSALWVAANLID